MLVPIFIFHESCEAMFSYLTLPCLPMPLPRPRQSCPAGGGGAGIRTCRATITVSSYIEPILLENGEGSPIYREVMRTGVTV